MSQALTIIGIILFVLLVVSLFGIRGLIYTCAPNEVLIFAGRKRRVGNRFYGFRLIKGGTGFKFPLIENVYRIDLTNMVIDITATNAYSKGGIPLTVQGVANAKIAGHEPLLYNAIERFLGKSRQDVMQIAKATLEGSLRGILATMTPEQVNEDKLLFAERLVAEVEQDMMALGLVVDTMKIQNVQDEVRYLESIGRKRNAEVVSKARVAEAIAQADAAVNHAINLERESLAQIQAEIEVAKAQAAKRLAEITSRRDALVAEEQAQVAALVAQARAELDVQSARIDQVRNKLQADVIAPAKASSEAAEANAKAQTALIVEEGRARADALRSISESWRQAGPNAREVLVAQKLDSIAEAIVNVIPEMGLDKVTLIAGNGASNPVGKAVGTLEQIKEVFGIDVVEKVQQLGKSKESRALPAKESEPEFVPQYESDNPISPTIRSPKVRFEQA
jgi:flotillin